ncbi:unnamed protein product [Enterobius vermicularis]|uniref:Uncharacterized protein n=1 Tax=Enterobius vermicularis TaxID=51028 RepID=A0A0N4VQB0_ENTVE|nr:unnamed protein product [Enterobius vermicularis]
MYSKLSLSSSVLLLLLLIPALFIDKTVGRFLTEPQGIETNTGKEQDGDEGFDGIGGSFDEPTKVEAFPDEQVLPDTAAAIDEFQSLPPTQQEKPKLQPNDESMIIVTDTNPISEDVREEFEPTQPQKARLSPPDCIPREVIEDKGERSSEELDAKEVAEDSLSPLDTGIEASTFSKVTDANMIEEPFKKVYFRPLCDD